MSRAGVTKVFLKAVLFDWDGRMLGFGSRRPMGALVTLFQSDGVDLSVDEARIPMGLPKWHHIQALGRLPRITQAWQAVHGRPFTDADVDALHEEFTPMSARSAAAHAQCIPGVLPTISSLRNWGLKIGTTNGYSRATRDKVVPVATGEGLSLITH